MALKTFKPVTPSLRQLVIVDRSGLWKGGPVKKLTRGKSSSGAARISRQFRSSPSTRPTGCWTWAFCLRSGA